MTPRIRSTLQLVHASLCDAHAHADSDSDSDYATVPPAHLALLRSVVRRLRHSYEGEGEGEGEGKDTLHATPLIADCEALKAACDAHFRTVHWSDVARGWRRLYTDVAIARAAGQWERVQGGGEGGEKDDAHAHAHAHAHARTHLLDAIRHLDLAIIVAGCPGRARHKRVLDLIALCQDRLRSSRDGDDDGDGDGESTRKRRRVDCGTSSTTTTTTTTTKTTPPPDAALAFDAPSLRARNPIPERTTEPSFESFTSHAHSAPFVLRGYARDWPAVQRWADGDYLVQVAAGGEGRVVPCEVGGKYTDDGWGQQISSWDEVLARSGWGGQTRKGGHQGGDGQDGTQVHLAQDTRQVYLAQHTLFKQFPRLEHDVLVPDFVYAAPHRVEGAPGYAPPMRVVEASEGGGGGGGGGAELTTTQDIIKSVWLGPAGTVSPAHTDPYFNAYVQVVGRKLVWVAPPHVDERGGMYCFGGGQDSQGADAAAAAGAAAAAEEEAEDAHSPSSSTSSAALDLTSLMTNTSRVDVFSRAPRLERGEIDEYPTFSDDVEPHAMSTLLREGDVLFLPPGWWHAMKSVADGQGTTPGTPGTPGTGCASVSMWF